MSILSGDKVVGWIAISPTSGRCVYRGSVEVSIALHKKCGFREIGYREKIAKDKFGVWQNTKSRVLNLIRTWLF